MTSPRLPQSLVAQQARVTTAIGRLLPSEGLEPRTVHGAMRYTALAPSKRVRAAVTVLAAELCGRANDGTIAVAASIELVHSASLILDDLPSMDNAPLRRGKPACHVAFGEAVAVLAAFGLLNLAFSTVARGLGPVLAARVATLIADAIGSTA